MPAAEVAEILSREVCSGSFSQTPGRRGRGILSVVPPASSHRNLCAALPASEAGGQLSEPGVSIFPAEKKFIKSFTAF